MAFTWNGAAACLNSGVDPVKLLSIKVNGGMDFNSECWDFLEMHCATTLQWVCVS
jgi:hypothetical protein